MARIHFTSHLQRYVDCPTREVEASTLGPALQSVFADNQRLAGYIFDDQQQLRKNIAVFIDGRLLQDREQLSDPLRPDSDVYVLQALSGG